MGKIKEHYHDHIVAASRDRIVDDSLRADDDYKFDLKGCDMFIRTWKRWYFRKNSKHPATIQLRCHCRGIEKRNWIYYIELWVNHKMISQDMITPEAYDSLSSDPKLKREELQNLEFVILFDTTQQFKEREQARISQLESKS